MSTSIGKTSSSRSRICGLIESSRLTRVSKEALPSSSSASISVFSLVVTSQFQTSSLSTLPYWIFFFISLFIYLVGEVFFCGFNTKKGDFFYFSVGDGTENCIIKPHPKIRCISEVVQRGRREASGTAYIYTAIYIYISGTGIGNTKVN